MNVGLLYTPVSIFQMTRGALVLFVGIFSVVFLRRRLWLYQYISLSNLCFKYTYLCFSRWVSLIIVMAGVALVGYSGSLIKDAIKVVTPLLARALGNHNDNSLIHSTAEEPELSRVLVGKFSCRHLMSKSNLNVLLLKAFSSFYLPKYCKSTPLLTHVGYHLFMIPH